MKTIKSIIVVLFVLLTAQIASAYYCPSTGRWLSRDPIGEPGFQALQTASVSPGIGNSVLQSSGRWVNRDSNQERGGLNLYGFVYDDPIQKIDLFGLSTGTITVPTSGPYIVPPTGLDPAGAVGWDIRLRWTPPKGFGCCQCKKAIWIQYVSRTLYPVVGPVKVEPWRVDWDESSYMGPPAQQSDLWTCGGFANGLDMWDTPNISSLGLLYYAADEFKAISQVKCIDGPDKGKTYGSVHWHYTLSGGITVTGGVDQIK